MGRALLVIAVLALAAGGAVLAGGGVRTFPGPHFDRPAAKAPPGDDVLVSRLMEGRARAVADPRALAATSTGAQRARDRRTARRAARLGLTRLSGEVADLEVRGRSARAVVRFRYGVRGIAGQYTTAQVLRAVKTSRGWRVRSVSGTRGRPPWEVADQRRSRSKHFVVWAPAEIDPRAGGLLTALEAGYARMREVLRRGRLRRRYLVVVAGDARQARALTAQIRGIESLAAITDSEVRQDGPAERVVEVASQRLLVVWPNFIDVDPEGKATVVTHELTHAAVAGVTSGRTPSWLVEGLALYVSGDRRVDEAAQRVVSGTGNRRALSLTGLTPPGAIGRVEGEGQSDAYAYSSAAAFYIAERFGQDKLLSLYDAYNDEALEGSGARLTDRAVRRELGLPLRRLERDLRAWILARAIADPLAP